MTQKHYSQWGTFHVTTNAKGREKWCIIPGIPEIIIDNLYRTTHIYEAEMIAFCVMPDHVHFIVRPAQKGLSLFVQSFKSNSAREIRRLLISRSGKPGLAVTETTIEASPVITGTTIKGNAIFGDPRSRQHSLVIQTMRFWQKGFHDERIRDERQLTKAFNYVTCNAMLHKLVEDPMDWPWTSLHKKTCI